MVYDLVSYRIDATILVKPNEKQEKFEEEGFGYYNLSNPGFDRIEKVNLLERFKTLLNLLATRTRLE